MTDMAIVAVALVLFYFTLTLAIAVGGTYLYFLARELLNRLHSKGPTR